MIIKPLDYIFFIFYLFIFLGIIYSIGKRTIPYVKLRKYFVQVFLLKAMGAFFIGVIYQYFYGFGDTFGYYNMGELFRRAYLDGNASLIEIFFTGDRAFFTNLAYRYNFTSWYAFNPQTVVIARFSCFFSIVGGGLYLTTALFFSIFSFWGVWQLYRTFFNMFPQLYKSLAWFILFIPSVIFWGSGLLKDSISIGALGLLTYSTYSLFIKKRKFASNIFIIIFSCYLLFLVKVYILVSFLPALLIWVLFQYKQSIKSIQLRRLFYPVLVAFLIFAFAYLNNKISESYEAFSLENIISTSSTLQQNISSYEAGSSYNIGTYDGSIGSYLLMLIPALVVTLYRPFPWEVNNLFSLLSAVESMFFIWFTYYILKKVGVKKTFRIVVNQPVILFTLIFSLIFAMAVGVASQNFGTLVRYKIPAMPFYLISLLLVFFYAKGRDPFNRPKKIG